MLWQSTFQCSFSLLFFTTSSTSTTSRIQELLHIVQDWLVCVEARVDTFDDGRSTQHGLEANERFQGNPGRIL